MMEPLVVLGLFVLTASSACSLPICTGSVNEGVAVPEAHCRYPATLNEQSMSRARAGERAWFFVDGEQVDNVQVTCGGIVQERTTTHYRNWTSFRVPRDAEVGATCSSVLGSVLIVDPPPAELSVVRIADAGEIVADCSVACRADGVVPLASAASVATLEVRGAPFFIQHNSTNDVGLIAEDGNVDLRERDGALQRTDVKWEIYSVEDTTQLVEIFILPIGTATPVAIDTSSLPMCEELNGCVVR